ncbi:MAG: sugar-binding protein [Armatimonadota bacterium]
MKAHRLAILLIITATACAAQPTVIGQKTQTAPTLDGKLDEQVWQQAEWYTGFTMLGETEERAEAQTQFAVAFDSANLYFGIKMQEPAMDELKADVTERDGKVHGDDCIEVMIDSTGDRTEYYHLSTNPIGTLYDSQLRQGGHVRALQWDCDWQAAVSLGDDFWAVEIAVPFVELGLTDASAGDWALNVARERKAGKNELSSFTTAPGGFHQPTYYAQLQLPDADLEQFMWTMRDPFDVSVRAQDGRISYSAKTHVTNHTGRMWLLQLHPQLINGDQTSDGDPVNVGLDDEQGREIEFSVPVQEQGGQVLRLRLVDRRDPERVLYVRSIPVTVEYTPLAIEMTRPNYRNNIYATQQIDAVELTVDLALGEEQIAGRRVSAAILAASDDGRGELVAIGEPVAAAEEVELSIPAADLPIGDYEVGVQIVNAEGVTEHRAHVPLRKLPPAPSGHEWRFDENNVMLHNGEPYLPFGWFSYRVDDHTDEDPYTAMQDYNAQWRSVEENVELLDRIAEKDLYVTMYPYSREFMNRDLDILKRPLNEEEAGHLRDRVTALMDHEALLAWYMADEPELKPVLPRRAEQIYQVCRDADPYHPCIMLNDTIAGIHAYAGGGDILMPDPYPLFLEDGLAARGIERTSEFIKAVNDATGGKKPAWVTPQAFNYGDGGRAGNRAPNFTELRNQMYQAVVYGTKGFLWYTYGHAKNYPALDMGMEFLGHEAQALKAAILAPDADDDVTVEADQPGHMHVAVRRAGGEVYVFAVNTATEPQDATITLADLPDALHVVSEDRQVQSAGGSITDSFDIYATHIYTTDATLDDTPTLASVRQRIAEADAAREKPGNLAFEDRGVEVEVSSGARYGNTPARVVDGIETGMGWRADQAADGDQWLALRWPEEQTFSRVVVFTPTIAELAVQAPDGDGWRTIGHARGDGEGPLEATFDSTTADRLRLLVETLAEDAAGPTIQEVEVYAK